MVNILDENYENLILNTLDTQNNLIDNNSNGSNSIQNNIISHFTGIDPDGKSFIALSGCKDENCYKQIANISDFSLEQTSNGIIVFIPRM